MALWSRVWCASLLLTGVLATLGSPHKKSLNCEAFCSKTGFQVAASSVAVQESATKVAVQVAASTVDVQEAASMYSSCSDSS